jgi:pimeloyl-ACP methyl ester carboxylesterase
VPFPVILLPGIIMPAADRYSALIKELGADVNATTKDLEVYRLPEPPSGYSIETEIAGISRTAREHGFDRFHLYGHSAGGAISIAFAAAYPDRLLSLALDEPAMDFTPQGSRRRPLGGISADRGNAGARADAGFSAHAAEARR